MKNGTTVTAKVLKKRAQTSYLLLVPPGENSLSSTKDKIYYWDSLTKLLRSP